MSSEYIKKFTIISRKDVDIAGGKGASLGEMTRAGIPVPPGFVVLANAFDEYLQESDLLQEIEARLNKVSYEDINSVERASLVIRDLINDTPIPEELSVDILKAYRELKSPLPKGGAPHLRGGGCYVAVRSSATAEDSSVASWAGELESFLNTTEETLLENIRKCWSSLFTPRAIFYRKEKNLHKQSVSVAVVVQQMVESEVSGITFTVHPVTKDTNQMIIEAAWGLGEAIVSGSITPDSYVVDKSTWEIIGININAQDKQVARGEKGETKWARVGDNKKEKQILKKPDIIKLAKLCLRIEKHYKFPQDIEWAYQAGRFYIVQSRPITTLK
jgi:pyruvate,water dikinase